VTGHGPLPHARKSRSHIGVGFLVGIQTGLGGLASAFNVGCRYLNRDRVHLSTIPALRLTQKAPVRMLDEGYWNREPFME